MRKIGLMFLIAVALCIFIPAKADAEPTVVRSLTLKVGESHLIGLADNSTGAPLQGLTWVSQNPAVASIDYSGNVSAISPGTTIVYASNLSDQRGVRVIVEGEPTPAPTAVSDPAPADTSSGNTPAVNTSAGQTAGNVNTTGSSASGSNATVIKAKKKIYLNKKSLTLEVKGSAKLKLVNAPAKKVKWSSSKKKVATVKKGKVKAKKAGKANITAKYKKKKYKCKVTVNKKKKAASSAANPASNGGPVAMKESTVVITEYPANIQLTLLNAKPGGITWKLKYPEEKNHVSVSSTGLVTVKINGTYPIQAVYEGKTYECTVYCFGIPKSIDGMVYYSHPKAIEHNMNEAQGMSISISGIEMADWDKITWSDSNPGVVSMEVGQGNGHVGLRPTGGGTATISATFMGKTATCTVTVKESPGSPFGD